MIGFDSVEQSNLRVATGAAAAVAACCSRFAAVALLLARYHYLGQRAVPTAVSVGLAMRPRMTDSLHFKCCIGWFLLSRRAKREASRDEDGPVPVAAAAAASRSRNRSSSTSSTSRASTEVATPRSEDGDAAAAAAAADDEADFAAESEYILDEVTELPGLDEAPSSDEEEDEDGMVVLRPAARKLPDRVKFSTDPIRVTGAALRRRSFRRCFGRCGAVTERFELRRRRCLRRSLPRNTTGRTPTSTPWPLRPSTNSRSGSTAWTRSGSNS